MFLDSRAQIHYLCCIGLVAPQHIESSRNRDQTHISCTDREIFFPLSHQENSGVTFFTSLSYFSLLAYRMRHYSMLILFWNLLNWYISWYIFYVVFRVFYTVSHVIYKQRQFYFFFYKLFLFLVWLLCLGLLILYWVEVVRRAPFSCSDTRGIAFIFASWSTVLDV